MVSASEAKDAMWTLNQFCKKRSCSFAIWLETGEIQNATAKKKMTVFARNRDF